MRMLMYLAAQGTSMDWVAVHLQQFPCLHSFWSILGEMPCGQLSTTGRWSIGSINVYRGNPSTLTGWLRPALHQPWHKTSCCFNQKSFRGDWL
ncbi:hypothetical protein WJX77_012588 [Trebouxia sp. C0004]